jgi:hypothetical protein
VGSPLHDSAKIDGSWGGFPSSGPLGHLLPMGEGPAHRFSNYLGQVGISMY